MSAFVMDGKFFDKLASELFAHATLNRSRLQWPVKYVLELHNVPENRYEETIQRFAQECYQANTAAVNYRYEELHPVPLLAFTKASGFPRWSNEQLIKHLECLSYQCAEGNCEQNAIYQKLEKLIGHLARAVVGVSDRYEAAKWDYGD